MDKDLRRRLKEEKIVRKARKDVNVFSEYIMRDAKTGSPIDQSSLHVSWQNHIDWCWEKGYHAGILAPWGHGKSNQLISRILFEIGNNKRFRGKIISNSDKIAKDRVNTIKNYIEHSNQYKTVFPDIEPNKNQWGAERFSIVRDVESPDPTLEANGILATGIGGRADFLLFDDVVDRKNAISEPKKQIQVIGNFYSVWMSRLEPGGKVAYIATRWTMTDLTSELLKSPSWAWLIQSVSKDMTHIKEEKIINVK